MRIQLEKGDKVRLLTATQLLEVFRRRNFFLNDVNRIEFSNILGNKEGIVSGIEEKYAFDYFYFLPDGNQPHQTYSVPYESVDFLQFAITKTQKQ